MIIFSSRILILNFPLCDYSFKIKAHKGNNDEKVDEVQRQAEWCSKNVSVLRLDARVYVPEVGFTGVKFELEKSHKNRRRDHFFNYMGCGMVYVYE